mmetsp:Transcript_49258/g.107164  ORF Transcript_49258/g.107164 Transcript_49258/m.107164 type:complete len:203 (-) Transcript_49258:1452-2060(-)
MDARWSRRKPGSNQQARLGSGVAPNTSHEAGSLFRCLPVLSIDRRKATGEAQLSLSTDGALGVLSRAADSTTLGVSGSVPTGRRPSLLRGVAGYGSSCVGRRDFLPSMEAPLGTGGLVRLISALWGQLAALPRLCFSTMDVGICCRRDGAAGLPTTLHSSDKAIGRISNLGCTGSAAVSLPVVGVTLPVSCRSPSVRRTRRS